ncbi:TPA: ABC transporter permease [Burkholderia multivorans]|nr:ABC transporter permease [Burkholderia multivorans]
MSTRTRHHAIFHFLPRTLSGAAGAALLAAPLLAGLAAIWWTPYGTTTMDFAHRFAPPNAAHWLGTDEFGRDVLSRLMKGALISMSISLETMLAASLLGAMLGAMAGYFRGPFERVMNTLTNALLAFPGIMLALGVMMTVGQNQTGLVTALTLAFIPSIYRVARSSAFSVSRREFVEASVLMGNGTTYTLIRHVLPNCLSPLVVIATSVFGWSILSESALSFLGMGVPPPAPSWGNMLAAARPFMATDTWLALFPGLCIAGVLLGVNLLGDALRDRFDPRTEARA